MTGRPEVALDKRIAEIDQLGDEIGKRIADLPAESNGQVEAALINVACLRGVEQGPLMIAMLAGHLRRMADLLETGKDATH